MRVLNIHGVGDVRLDPVDPPRPGSKDVVVKVKACGICGSDLTYIKIGGIIRAPGGTTPIGHEAAGEVIAVGDDVSGVSVGQRVVINPMLTPSDIGSGGPEGAFTEELLVRDARVGDSLLPIPDDLPYEIAALTEPLAVAMHGVNRAEAKPGDKVVVFGCGPIGLGMVLWLVDRGVTDVVALDLAPERLDARRGARRARGLRPHARRPPCPPARAARLGAHLQPRRRRHGCVHRCGRRTEHPSRRGEDGEVPIAHGRDGRLYETDRSSILGACSPPR